MSLEERQNLSAADRFTAAVRRHARYTLGDRMEELTGADRFAAVSLAVRDFLMDRLLDTEERYRRSGAKRLYYLSMEFLMGRSLENNLQNLGLRQTCRRALDELGVDWDAVVEEEPDAGLGNGGLGRLAACFLDSMATLDLPGFGYGINYEYGLFRQEIRNGYQREQPDHWRSRPTPWQIERPNEAVLVPLYGRIEHARDRQQEYNPMWLDWKLVVGVPFDMPIVGYGGRTVNYLRLYAARASREFDMQIFNDGEYFRAVEQKITTETISKVLYPSDAIASGRELRLIQEYFLVACAVRDIAVRFEQEHGNWERLPEQVAIQLNDTHPALTVAELMRLLIDEKDLTWEKAWELTGRTVSYTNHTLLPEALEKWPVSLLERVLPRHLQIIYEINRRFLDEVRVRWPEDEERARRMSLIEEGDERQVRMANLAIVGSHSINGVSSLHTELVKQSLVPEFYQCWPERFNNKTNGITPRRWLLKANPGLAELITGQLGEGWITDLEELRKLEACAEDASFREAFARIKHANKERLVELVERAAGVRIDPDTLYDVQIKRIHQYKRQLLNVMHIIHLYLRLIEDGVEPASPRTCIFAGKAAPGYWAAKQIIKLIHEVGRVINNDPRVGGWLRVVFLPDYRVSLAERLIPAADLSEQISTAGMEASGTGNMKFALNGALTMGTLDGANIEIRDEVGSGNIYTFGLTVAEIEGLRNGGTHRPREYYEQDDRVRRVLDGLAGDRFCPQEPELFHWISRELLDESDPYFHLADFNSYLEAQEQAARDYARPAAWNRKAVLNVARTGKFSSDRTIREYAREIWKIEPVI